MKTAPFAFELLAVASARSARNQSINNMADDGMKFSIIVPMRNEAALLPRFLEHLRACAPEAEIIVVDGESTDGSAGLAASHADRVLRTSCGRARQMNAGAAVSSGHVLWFLHADSRLPVNAVAQIETALREPDLVGGCFALRFPRREYIYRLSDSLGNRAVDLFRIALGDHGFFCRRSAFEKAGGFPDVPLMEDAEFYRALGRYGRTRQLRAAIQTSPRRYEEFGPYRTTAIYLLLITLYLARFPLPLLARLHRYFFSDSISLVTTPALHEA